MTVSENVAYGVSLAARARATSSSVLLSFDIIPRRSESERFCAAVFGVSHIDDREIVFPNRVSK
jgi:hypothetical protein